MTRRFEKATLVVHPERPVAQAMAAALREQGWAVLVATSHHDALGALPLCPDVVIAGGAVAADLAQNAFLAAVRERSPGSACVLLSPFDDLRVACAFFRSSRGSELVRDVERCLAHAEPPVEDAV